MAQDPASDHAPRLLVWGCILAVAVAVAGIWYTGLGQSRVLEAVQSKVAQPGGNTFLMDYMGDDGNMHHVSVTSESGESPEHHALRFRDAVDAMKDQYPQRR